MYQNCQIHFSEILTGYDNRRFFHFNYHNNSKLFLPANLRQAVTCIGFSLSKHKFFLPIQETWSYLFPSQWIINHWLSWWNTISEKKCGLRELQRHIIEYRCLSLYGTSVSFRTFLENWVPLEFLCGFLCRVPVLFFDTREYFSPFGWLSL